MDIDFIKGREEIESHFGYFPTFHDDYIDSIEITSECIAICIRMESSPVNLKPNANERLKLIFGGVKAFGLSGEMYGCVSIIRDIVFDNNTEMVTTRISTSLGTEGSIQSKTVAIELIK